MLQKRQLVDPGKSWTEAITAFIFQASALIVALCVVAVIVFVRTPLFNGKSPLPVTTWILHA